MDSAAPPVLASTRPRSISWLTISMLSVAPDPASSESRASCCSFVRSSQRIGGSSASIGVRLSAGREGCALFSFMRKRTGTYPGPQRTSRMGRPPYDVSGRTTTMALPGRRAGVASKTVTQYQLRPSGGLITANSGNSFNWREEWLCQAQVLGRSNFFAAPIHGNSRPGLVS